MMSLLLNRRALLIVLSLLTFTTPIAAEQVLDIQQYRGNVVVVDFWASWCVPCRRSFPWMNEMHRKYADDGLVIVAVNLDASHEDAAKFLSEFSTDFEIVDDPNGDIARAYDVIAMPSSYVFDRQGKLLETHLGFKVRRQPEYEAILVNALAGRGE